MSFTWETEAEKSFADRIPDGEFDLIIDRVVMGNQNGPFTSNNGDPQIMVVFADQQAREASTFLTLNDRAGFKLAQIMKAVGADLARMTQAGVMPEHFANEEFAQKNLVGRQLRARITTEEGRDGKERPQVTPLGQVDTPAAAPPAQPAPAAPPVPSSGKVPTSKGEAWAYVVEAWDAAVKTDPAKAPHRDKAWLEAIKAKAKSEDDFTPSDWADVAYAAEVPF